MKRILFAIIMFLSSSVFASEIIVDFEKESLPVLNEQLRVKTNDIRSNTTDIDSNTTLISEIVTVPTGGIVMWGTATAPTNFLLCNGQAVSRTTYADLFTVIGTGYGVGDGSTTFDLPDIDGRVVVGYDSGDGDFDLKDTGGAKTHTLSIAEMPSHSHQILFTAENVASTDGFRESTVEWQTSKGIGAAGRNTASTGSGSAHNNLQPYITLNYIIKI